MALVIDLKPGEKVLVGDAVITNDNQRTRLHIAGNTPIMREKDILQETDADTPCKQIYFLIQCMYMANSSKDYQETYFKLLNDIQDAAPSCTLFFIQISEHILADKYYKALKVAKQLIDHESELLGHVK